jgi:protein-L-isoaspartate(D-aspartate) O-methyltransferase
MDAMTRARTQLVDGVLQRLGLAPQDDLRAALLAVPRHLFVDSALAQKAYQDIALPIGFDQTISQPTVVAMMTHALAMFRDAKVLEIGTGSGYQTAVLAYYTKRLYTVERHAGLSQRAQKLLDGMGMRNVIFKTGDGSQGWESWAPYDRIIVTAGAPVIAEKLRLQLADGGRLVIPCGNRESQKLMRVDRRGAEFTETDLGECRFVPLIGRGGWDSP